MRNEKIHSTLLGVVGGYILYLAYQLFEKYRAGTKEMPDAVFIAAIIFFTIAGIGTLIFAWKTWRKATKEDRANGEKDSSDPGNQRPDSESLK